MKISVLAKSEYPLWDSFVLSSRNGAFYHLSCWGNAIEEAYHHDFFIVAAKNEENGIVCGVPLIKFKYPWKECAYSMPYATNAGFCGGNEEIKEKIESYLLSNFNFSSIEFREFSANGIGENSMVTQIVDLRGGSEFLWKRIDSSLRARVRKGRRMGLSIIAAGDCLESFYKIFSEKMHRFGTPPHSRRIFSCLLKHGKGNVDLFIVKRGHDNIGGIFLGYTDECLYDPWIATDDNYRDLCPSDFLYWSIIEWACAKGLKFFDLGRSKMDSGVHKFKKKWGASDVPLCYRRLFRNGDVEQITEHMGNSPLASLFASVWKRLPRAANSYLGPYARKYIP